MSKVYQILVLVVLLCGILAAKPGKRRSDAASRRLQAMTKESSINVQLVKATAVEIGFDFIQGAYGFAVSAKEWIDGKYEQSIATDSQMLNVQKRSAVLRKLIPGRDYLIQVQATNRNRKPFGSVQEKIIRTAQRCYVCNGVEGNEECDADRDTIECPADKNACLNVVRFDNNKKTITKRCAQYDKKLGEVSGQSCSGKQAGMKDSVCRCMCRSNLCNQQMLPCVGECLEDLPMPLNSNLICTNGQKIGSVCRWACDEDYFLIGLKESQCRKDRTWSVLSPPQCIHKDDPRAPKKPKSKAGKKQLVKKPAVKKVVVKKPLPPKNCKPMPYNGKQEMECTNGGKHNSVCSITCKSGFTKVSGSNVQTCRNGKWNGVNLICKEIVCPSVEYTFGVANCSDSTKIGSVCDIVTPSTMTCQVDGSWISSHTCFQQQSFYDVKSISNGCPPLSSPEYGSVKCSEDRTICRYICANGYQMVGETPLRRCEDGIWTGAKVECQEITCGDPSKKPNVEGVLKCSNDDRIGSVCEVITPASMTCQTNGEWSMPFQAAPKCKECVCP